MVRSNRSSQATLSSAFDRWRRFPICSGRRSSRGSPIPCCAQFSTTSSRRQRREPGVTTDTILGNVPNDVIVTVASQRGSRTPGRVIRRTCPFTSAGVKFKVGPAVTNSGKVNTVIGCVSQGSFRRRLSCVFQSTREGRGSTVRRTEKSGRGERSESAEHGPTRERHRCFRACHVGQGRSGFGVTAASRWRRGDHGRGSVRGGRGRRAVHASARRHRLDGVGRRDPICGRNTIGTFWPHVRSLRSYGADVLRTRSRGPDFGPFPERTVMTTPPWSRGRRGGGRRCHVGDPFRTDREPGPRRFPVRYKPQRPAPRAGGSCAPRSARCSGTSSCSWSRSEEWRPGFDVVPRHSPVVDKPVPWLSPRGGIG